MFGGSSPVTQTLSFLVWGSCPPPGYIFSFLSPQFLGPSGEGDVLISKDVPKPYQSLKICIWAPLGAVTKITVPREAAFSHSFGLGGLS